MTAAAGRGRKIKTVVKKIIDTYEKDQQ